MALRTCSPLELALGQGVGEEARDRPPVQPHDVVGVEEGLVDQLPVAGHRADALAKEGLVTELEGLEVLVETSDEGVEVHGRVRVEVDPDQAVADLGRDRHQVQGRAIEPGEAGLARDRLEASVEAVRPVVVRAHEGLEGGDAFVVEEAGVAVAADVEEGADPALPVAEGDERGPGPVVDQRIARLRDLGLVSDGQGAGREHPLLELEPFRAGVDLGRDPVRRRLGQGVAGADALDQPGEQLEGLLAAGHGHGFAGPVPILRRDRDLRGRARPAAGVRRPRGRGSGPRLGAAARSRTA